MFFYVGPELVTACLLFSDNISVGMCKHIFTYHVLILMVYNGITYPRLHRHHDKSYRKNMVSVWLLLLCRQLLLIINLKLFVCADH